VDLVRLIGTVTHSVLVLKVLFFPPHFTNESKIVVCGLKMYYKDRYNGFEVNPILVCDISVVLHLGICVNVAVLWPEVSGWFLSVLEFHKAPPPPPVDSTAYVSCPCSCRVPEDA
jgi:hypothetical protein